LIVRITKEADEKTVLASAIEPLFTVEQANTKAIAPSPPDKDGKMRRSFGRVAGDKVMAFVPVCEPDVARQVSERSFRDLAVCYENTILAAVRAGAKSVAVRQLGVWRKVNPIFEEGKMIGYDIWGDLFWTVSRSAAAASLAVRAANSKIPSDTEVFFVVPDDAYAEWDSTMSF
jgi:hypothetical protein